MSGVDPVYQEVVDESEEIESTGHVTVEGDPRNFIKNFRDKYENHPNMFFRLTRGW